MMTTWKTLFGLLLWEGQHALVHGKICYMVYQMAGKCLGHPSASIFALEVVPYLCALGEHESLTHVFSSLQITTWNHLFELT